MILVRRNLLYTKGGATPVPPTPPGPGGYQLLYLQNGDNTGSNAKVRGWSIDTGITWRDYFASSSFENPGLYVKLVYSQPGTPEGGLVAGCNPRKGSTGTPGQGNRDMGGFWRYFGHSGAQFCLDCPSEDDRVSFNRTLVANQVYTAEQLYGSVNGTYQTKLTVSPDVGTSHKYPNYSWQSAKCPHNLYLFSDNEMYEYNVSGDTSCRSGTRIYQYEIWTLNNGVKAEKIYDGWPWMDANGVPCWYDKVSGQLQYNCSKDGNTFLYGEIT